MPEAQGAKHCLVGPDPAVAKPDGQTHCSEAAEFSGIKFALQVQEAGPPDAVEPSGQAAHEKTVAEPDLKKLSLQVQNCEAGELATALGSMVEQFVQAVPLGTMAAYVCAGQTEHCTGGPLSTHDESACRRVKFV